jgi:hypothetical protein
VLRAQAEHRGPREPLVGGDDLPFSGGLQRPDAGTLPLASDGFGDLRSGVHAELVEDAAHVALDRLLRQEELGRDLAVRAPERDEIDDLALAAGQPGEPVAARGAPAPRTGLVPAPAQLARCFVA